MRFSGWIQSSSGKTSEIVMVDESPALRHCDAA
jgi:hypothetical protein